jgi:hypothetical protein
MMPAKLKAHAETLLKTISALAEEAPDFEEAGVETFECGEIGQIDNIPAPMPLAWDARASMVVKIDGQPFMVIAYPIAD